ncbi:hypothetical protein HMPREF9163_01436 [Selenomonas sp. oral taxon 138 str. F0429]|nr:hypothetical protein HMPREF9163_01436 [Selenomonas sp. oral taxon 138 str. F0429]
MTGQKIYTNLSGFNSSVLPCGAALSVRAAFCHIKKGLCISHANA